MKKKAELSLELARKMYKEGGVAKDFALENFSEKELNCSLPKTWEELKTIKGWGIDNQSNIYNRLWGATEKSNKSLFATPKQAQASIALAQLSQLMYVYNEGWTPDWGSLGIDKYVIILNQGDLITAHRTFTQHFLAFKSGEIRDKFLENFRELIEQAKPLL